MWVLLCKTPDCLRIMLQYCTPASPSLFSKVKVSRGAGEVAAHDIGRFVKIACRTAGYLSHSLTILPKTAQSLIVTALSNLLSSACSRDIMQPPLNSHLLDMALNQ